MCVCGGWGLQNIVATFTRCTSVHCTSKIMPTPQCVGPAALNPTDARLAPYDPDDAAVVSLPRQFLGHTRLYVYYILFVLKVNSARYSGRSLKTQDFKLFNLRIMVIVNTHPFLENSRFYIIQALYKDKMCSVQHQRDKSHQREHKLL